MRALLQRVNTASVTVDDRIIGEIQQGLLVLLGIQKQDSEAVADKLLNKIIHYRLFADEAQKMNLSVKDIRGGLLLVSQFTLAADTKKGLRPSFSSAAEPTFAEGLYGYFVRQAEIMTRDTGMTISTGLFGADMKVSLTNDGPVTFLLEQ